MVLCAIWESFVAIVPNRAELSDRAALPDQAAVPQRSRGVRFEVLRTRPHDHIAWIFSGPSEFAALATPYLAEGAQLGEKVMYVAEVPDRTVLRSLERQVRPQALQVASVAEIYGASGIVHPPAQRATYAALLADALQAGYSGLRVVADNTSLVADEERFRAWIRWELVADRLIAETQMTALCAFNQQKVDVDRLRHLATIHPMSSTASPVPQFRLFSEAHNLYIEGELDSFAVTQLWLALDNLPPSTGVVIDLASVTIMSRSVIAGLRELPAKGVSVTIRGCSMALDELRASGSLGDRLVLEEI
jgi:hypothetical protein